MNDQGLFLKTLKNKDFYHVLVNQDGVINIIQSSNDSKEEKIYKISKIITESIEMHNDYALVKIKSLENLYQKILQKKYFNQTKETEQIVSQYEQNLENLQIQNQYNLTACKILIKEANNEMNINLIQIQEDFKDKTQLRFNALDQIYSLSELHQLADEDVAWVPPTTFDRKTVKYWCPVDELFNFMATICRHLPVLLINKDVADSNQRIKDFDFQIPTPRCTQEVSSIQIDADDHVCQFNRLNRFEGAFLVRQRWQDNTPEDTFQIEMKTHHETYNLSSSVKERVTVRDHHLLAIQEPNFDMRTIPNPGEIELLREIHSKINQYDLVPKILTRYNRIAFQKQTSNDVRITIDFDLEVGRSTYTFDEDDKEGLKQHTRKLKQAKFPQAVVEIKLLTGLSNPDWIENLIRQGILINKHKFSKFLSGMSIFNENAILKSKDHQECKFPYWQLDDRFLEYRSNNLTLYQRAGETGNPAFNVENPMDQQEYYNKVKTQLQVDKVRIEPKTIFSNERTFIKQVHFALLLFGLGVFVFNQVKYPLYILLSLIGAAMAVLLYSFINFVWRSRRLWMGVILGKMGDLVLPIVQYIVVVVAVVLLVTYLPGYSSNFDISKWKIIQSTNKLDQIVDVSQQRDEQLLLLQTNSLHFLEQNNGVTSISDDFKFENLNDYNSVSQGCDMFYFFNIGTNSLEERSRNKLYRAYKNTNFKNAYRKKLMSCDSDQVQIGEISNDKTEIGLIKYNKQNEEYVLKERFKPSYVFGEPIKIENISFDQDFTIIILSTTRKVQVIKLDQKLETILNYQEKSIVIGLNTNSQEMFQGNILISTSFPIQLMEQIQ